MNYLYVSNTSEGVPVTTTIAIAEGTEIQHKNVLELVRTYMADFEEFGRVPFETQPFQTTGGEQHREVAVLNEDHATLLLTYMRNSEIVRGFKKRLIVAFREAKSQAFQVPKTYAAALRLASEQAERIEEQAKQLEQAQPAVEFLGRYVEAKSTKSLREVAKVLSVPERQFIKQLEDDGILFRQSGCLLPCAERQHAGRFEVKTGETNGHAFHQTRFTPDGIAWIAKRIARKAA
jgi:phage antirepressor YoqD-like protein